MKHSNIYDNIMRTLFLIFTGKYCPRSKYQQSLQGRYNDLVILLFITQKSKKSYRREAKLFEFLQDTKREELKIRKRDVTFQ